MCTGAAFLTQTVRVEQGFVKFEVRSLPLLSCSLWELPLARRWHDVG